MGGFVRYYMLVKTYLAYDGQTSERVDGDLHPRNQRSGNSGTRHDHGDLLQSGEFLQYPSVVPARVMTVELKLLDTWQLREVLEVARTQRPVSGPREGNQVDTIC